MLDNAYDEKREQNKEFVEVRRQVEEDADRELLGMKNKYERKLKEEKESSIRLSGENGILRKKCKGLEVRSAARCRMCYYIYLAVWFTVFDCRTS